MRRSVLLKSKYWWSPAGANLKCNFPGSVLFNSGNNAVSLYVEMSLGGGRVGRKRDSKVKATARERQKGI